MTFTLIPSKRIADGAPSPPRDATRSERKTDSERLKYQGMLFVIPG